MGEIHNFEANVKRAEELLEKSAISEENKQLIRAFVEFKTAEGVKLPRIGKYYYTLRLLAERYLGDRNFTALTKENIISIVAKIERSDFKSWTKRDNKIILKMFFQWLGREEEVAWIKGGNPGNTTLPEDLITEREIKAMIDAAHLVRDKALIACLYEGALRIGEVGGLTIGNISFDRYGAIAMVTGKTGMRRVRLIFAMPYLAQWLELHPFRENRNAPLWIYQSKRPKAQSMQYGALRQLIRRIGERAGVGGKLNPHNFRHSRGTFLAGCLTDAQRNEYMGLVQGSKMGSVYVHLSGRDLDADLLRMYGLEPEEKSEEELKTLQCPHCKTLNTAGARICINCRKPLQIEEVVQREEKAMELFKDFMDTVATHPEVMQKYKKYFEDREE